MVDIVTFPTRAVRLKSDVLDQLEHLLDLAKKDTIESFIAVAFKASGDWVTIFSGQIDTLKKIGILKSMKSDLLDSLK